MNGGVIPSDILLSHRTCPIDVEMLVLIQFSERITFYDLFYVFEVDLD